MKCRATLFVMKNEGDETPIEEVPSVVFPAVHPTPNSAGPPGYVTALYGTRDTSAGLQQIYFWAMSIQKAVAQIDISFGVEAFVPIRQGLDQLAEITLLNVSSLTQNLKTHMRETFDIEEEDISEAFNRDLGLFSRIWENPQYAHIDGIAWKMDITKKNGQPGKVQVCTVRELSLIDEVTVRNMFELDPSAKVVPQE